MDHAWPWGARLQPQNGKWAAADVMRQVWHGIGQGFMYPGQTRELLATSIREIERTVHTLFGDGEWEPPQLLIRWPAAEYDKQPQKSHVDRTPKGDLYDIVVGFYITEAYPAVEVDGKKINVNSGDIVWWRGDTPHRGLLNLTSTPTMALYFRRRK